MKNILSKLPKISLPSFNFKKAFTFVEIGNDWLKIAENSPSPAKGNLITRIGLEKLAQIKETVSEAIAKIFKEMKLNKTGAVTYIPRHLITVRILELPSTDPKEISDMVNLQVGKQTPYSKEEIISGHKIIYSEREGYTKVMLAIAQRSLVNERVEALAKAGVRVEKVAVSSESVYNWFRLAYAEWLHVSDAEAVVLVDIDSNYSDFIVIRRRKLVFTRNIFIGANHLLEEPAPERAPEIRPTGPARPEGIFVEPAQPEDISVEPAQPEVFSVIPIRPEGPVIDTWLDKFVDELKRSLERYQAEEKGVKVVKIFLSGAARSVEDLDAVLSAALDIQAETTDPLKGVPMSKEITVLSDPSYRFVSLTPLLGAAINRKDLELDLTPTEQRIQKLMEAKRKQLTIMGVLFAAIIMTATFLLLVNIYNRNAYLAQLKQKVARIEQESGEVEKMRAGVELVEKRLDSKYSSINTLDAVYKLTPPQIYFTIFDVDEGERVIIRGRAAAMSDVFNYVKTLEKSDMFENVKATYTTMKKERDAEYAEFEVVCSFQK